jgi:hypothetical protein
MKKGRPRLTFVKIVSGDYTVLLKRKEVLTLAYYKDKDVLHILDIVMSDDSIKHKGKAIRKRLKELPGEDVEKVVYCKDCEYYSVSHLACLYPYHNGDIGINGFCSYGVRKEGAEE